MPSAGVSQFISWNGGCVFIGRGSTVVPVHAHYAIQIAFGAEPGIRFRTNATEDWTSYTGAMIPSRQPHSMDATPTSANAVMFIEPETREGRAIDELYLQNGITAMPEHALAAIPAIFGAWEQGDRSGVTAGCVALTAQLTRGVEPARVSDERILRAITFINANLDAKLTLEDVAGAAFLSPGRFRHLFVEQTGMALRPYILWRRFLKVWELIQAGETVSSAAHVAGFADAAHLSRTSRRTFGFPPTAMLMAASATQAGE